MNKIKLSIIIPTYNGADCIEDAINSVLVQLPPYKDSVEFIVRDNCSKDLTGTIVKEINEKNNNIIRYERRGTTVIADENYKESIELSRGDYILLLGDDDLLFPNYIRTTLDLIDENPEVGMIYYNRITTSRQYKGAYLKHKDPNRTFFKKFDGVESFIHNYPSGPDFMSVNVVKRECIEKGWSYEKEKYYGVGWYSVILYGLNNYQILSFFSPMILQRYPIKRIWYDRQLLFVVVGCDNLFSDLSLLYPTIYQSWLSYSNENVSKLQYIFKSVPLNRKLYKEKWAELRVKLNFFERIVAILLLRFPYSEYVLSPFVQFPNKLFLLYKRYKNKAS